jgi:hypothetical protein
VKAEAERRQADFIVHSKLDDLPLSPVEFRLYCHMVRRAGLGGIFYESIPNAARHCQVRIETLRRALHKLITVGLIRLADTPPGRTRTYDVFHVDAWAPELLAKEDPTPQSQGDP